MVPEECTYTKEHEWVCYEGGIATIGISEYAATELGDIVYIELTEAGSNVKQMDPIGTIEAVKTVAELFSPVSGEIIEVNAAIIEHPEIINRDPFEEGWFIKIRISDAGELDNLFTFEEYSEFLSEQED